MFVLDTPLNPDGPTARRWLQRELSKPEYQEHKPLWQRFVDWLEDQLPDASIGGLTIPWYVFAVLLFLVLLGVVAYSARRFTRAQRVEQPAPTGGEAVFGTDTVLDAASYRADAERLLDSDPAAAVVAAYRAVVMHAGERGVVDLTPSTTVGDLDAALTTAVPGQRDIIEDAGASFTAVRYGALSATSAQARAILQLDDALASARPGGYS